ncbi:hypothetical protein PG993_008383 [Apiospora rasikravindrae]|uniref:Uncharacterized protein n=1 Tax=Apiospora rasikravindrae TaxID=990691 RepID=A0ABR1T061_9PEZI
MEAVLCQSGLVRPVEYRVPWCFPTPLLPENKTIRYKYYILASQDEAVMTYGTTPVTLAAVSKYLRSLARHLWRLFIGTQSFLLEDIADGAETPLLRFLAAQPRWVLPYYRHIMAGAPLDSVQYRIAPLETIVPDSNFRHAGTLTGPLPRDIRFTVTMWLPYLTEPPNKELWQLGSDHIVQTAAQSLDNARWYI